MGRKKGNERSMGGTRQYGKRKERGEGREKRIPLRTVSKSVVAMARKISSTFVSIFAYVT